MSSNRFYRNTGRKLVIALIALCPSLVWAGSLYPTAGTLLATANLTIPASPSAPESVTFSGVTLVPGQMYWVAVLPGDADSGAYWAQNPNLGQYTAFSGDGINWGDSGYGIIAYPGEFDVKDTTGNVIYSNMTNDPFNTGHAWATSGANLGYNAYASPFIPTTADVANSIDVVLTLNSFQDPNNPANTITYGPNATVELYGSTANGIVSTPPSTFTFDNSQDTVSNFVNNNSDGSGYNYAYSVSYTGSNNVLAIPLINPGDVTNLSGGLTMVGLNSLPETVQQLFGPQFTTALVFNLPDSQGTNTLPFSFTSAYAPSEVSWGVFNTNDGSVLGFDPPTPQSATPEPSMLWCVPGVLAAALWQRRRAFRANGRRTAATAS